MIIVWTYWNKSQDAQYSGLGKGKVWNYSFTPGGAGGAPSLIVQQRSFFRFIFSRVWGRTN